MSRVTAWWATSVEETAPILDRWTQLSVTLGKPLSTPGWLLAWWAERPDPRWQLRVLVAEEDGEVAAVVPLYSDGRQGCLRLLGQPVGLWGYGPLVNPASSPAVMAALARELARIRPETIAFDGLDAGDSALVERLAEVWPWPGIQVVVSRREAGSRLRLEGTLEDWMSSKSRSWRANVRRRHRRLTEAGGSMRLAATPAELEADLEPLLELHRSQWQGHSAWLTPHMEKTLRTVVRDPDRGGVCIQTVAIDGRVIFATFVAAAGGNVISVFGGFDREYDRFGPGILAHAAVIAAALERGERCFDFGWAGQHYKSQFCDDFGEVAWYELRPRAARHALPPADQPRRAGRSPGAGRATIAIGADVFEPVRNLGAAAGTTLHTTLVAAFAVLLSRWTGRDDVAIGCSVGRGPGGDLAGPADGMGDVVLVRISLEGSPTVHELLARVQENFDEARASRSRAVDGPEEPLRTEPISGCCPPGFVLVRFLDAPGAGRLPSGAAPEHTPSPDIHPGVDIELRLWPAGDALAGEAVYADGVFEAPTIDRLLGHWQVLLRGIVAAPDSRIIELPLLTPAERQQLVVAWNDTAVEYPRHEPLPRLFEAVVDRAPGAVALVADRRQMTYRTLDDQANRLAHRLIAFGAVPGAFVGIALPRSTDFVVAVLAILKAGGAYVPFGREYPPERQRAIGIDAGIGIVICNTATAALWRDAGIAVVDIEADAAVITGFPATRPTVAAHADAPAYVMHTSGSTGKPKGVVIPHRGVTRLVLGTSFLPWGPELRFLLLAPTAFDASTLELWGPLLHGATLVVHTAEDLDPSDLGRLMARENVTCLWLTAALFNRIIDDCPAILAPVRHLMTGGEPLSPRHVGAALELLPETRIINGYGPTETTTFATTHEIGRTPPLAADQPIPIGRPIANTRCLVLDGHRQPVPVGVAGELWIGGDGVGLGYLGDAERTAERFAALPLGSHSGERWYRTGDRVRWRPDGSLDFLGRTDDQVKIRGFRIEPGEVEAALARHPAVQDALVVVREDVPGEKRLVAYLVAKASRPEPTHADICDFLRSSLPPAMIPAASVLLPSFPLTANGKVDRGALPRPEPSVSGGGPDAPPHTELEASLLRIWEDIFGGASIGRDDHFFDIGGNSLLAMRLATDLTRLLGRRVPVAVVFESPTIASLARWAAAAPARAATPRSSAIVPLAVGGGGPPLFLAHGVRGDVFHFAGLARLLAPHADVHGLHARDRDGPYPATLTELCAEYVADIRAVTVAGPCVVGGYSLGGWVAFEVARQLAAEGRQVTLLLFDVFPNCRVRWPAAACAWACDLLFEACSIAKRAELHARRLSRVRARDLPVAMAGLVRPFVRRVARMAGWKTFDKVAGDRAVALPTAGVPAPDPLFPLVVRYEARRFEVEPVLFQSGSLPAVTLPLFWRLLLGRRLRVHRLRQDHHHLFDADGLPGLAALIRESLYDSGPDRPRG